MDISIVSLDNYLADPSSAAAIAEAKALAESLILTGAVIVRDKRAVPEANERFLDLFEDYFSQPTDLLKEDERPELGYQVGVTLENTEKPKCGSDKECQSIIASLEAGERPLDLTGHNADPKCRYFHRMSVEPPYESKFPISKAPNVVPKAFEGVWEDRVDEWGFLLKQSVEGVAQMLAVGLGLEKDSIIESGHYGSHLLAPTATDLVKYGRLNTIYAGFHTDLNFLTIHGQSRYPGRKRIQVRIPPGCLLVQAGKQLEWMTGGLIEAGFHEVACTQATLDAMERRKVSHPDRPLNRISSTFFWHLSPDHLLEPDPVLRQVAEKRFGPQKEYGQMLVGDQVLQCVGYSLLEPVGEYCNCSYTGSSA
ncbi:hypothetical protein DB88DRAFT_505325 [Papiliotrema laurentii]|uniref:Isopenicillin N synthase-like Fe(2+) 2OG dioxygenase domain-containing protein n=1 Tax=Papiliotrema laurentii TaxID=5418 RepID=A0AAD9CZ37_PAPLA|nr:hypothetical protein DB88DRAFT_505325 [Papiliotrema laurentii]